MQRESVRFDVNMPAAVVRIPRVEERPQLGLVRRHHRQQVRLERVRGQLLHALRPPHLVVLVAEEPVPTFTHQRTIPQILQLQVGKDQLQHVVRNVRRVLGEVVIHRGQRQVRARVSSGFRRNRTKAGCLFTESPNPLIRHETHTNAHANTARERTPRLLNLTFALIPL